MKISNLEIGGLKLIEKDIFHDERGFLIENFEQRKFSEAGINDNFVQDLISHSKPNVIRGLHFQSQPAQAKIVSCARGKILDVAVDIRSVSPTFGHYFAVELADDNGKALYIPAGFAHGFAVLGDEPANVTYKIAGEYKHLAQGAIRFDDADLAINWDIAAPIVSAKDMCAKSFAEYCKSPNF